MDLDAIKNVDLEAIKKSLPLDGTEFKLVIQDMNQLAETYQEPYAKLFNIFKKNNVLLLK